jgi:hypothetical protein
MPSVAFYFIIMLNVNMPRADVLIAVMLNVVMLSVLSPTY